MEELEIKNELKRTNDLLLKLNKLDLFNFNNKSLVLFNSFLISNSSIIIPQGD
ncbi:MAG: hypothetical protein K6A63_01165 [Acholeplasmatales bacterium]|nr:hypothetical protein [Acholeplasmatales bacterium]